MHEFPNSGWFEANRAVIGLTLTCLGLFVGMIRLWFLKRGLELGLNKRDLESRETAANELVRSREAYKAIVETVRIGRQEDERVFKRRLSLKNQELTSLKRRHSEAADAIDKHLHSLHSAASGLLVLGSFSIWAHFHLTNLLELLVVERRLADLGVRARILPWENLIGAPALLTRINKHIEEGIDEVLAGAQKDFPKALTLHSQITPIKEEYEAFNNMYHGPLGDALTEGMNRWDATLRAREKAALSEDSQ